MSKGDFLTIDLFKWNYWQDKRTFVRQKCLRQAKCTEINANAS